MTRKPDREEVNIPRRPSRNVDPAHPVYEVDIWLVDSQPPIWRTLAVPAEMTLDDLHFAIQIAFGWQNCHMHRFESQEGMRFEPVAEMEAHGVPAFETFGIDEYEPPTESATTTLRDVFAELKVGLAYIYDFGDDWVHGIRIVNTHADTDADADTFAQLPVCLDGRLAGPPEDSGGMHGYYHNLEILKNPDPDDEWHQDLIEWMGGDDFDPEAFNLDAINKTLRQFDWTFDPPIVVVTKKRKPKNKKKTKKKQQSKKKSSKK